MAGYIGTKAVNLSTTGADIAGDADVSGALDVGGAFTSQGIDDNASSTAMTLDGSGNLLVGKTSTATGAGFEARSDGQIVGTRSANRVAFLNRLTSNGDIVQFAKDGTTVGSIGTHSSTITAYQGAGATTVGGGDVGLFFSPDNDNIIPVTATASATRDNAIDLGASNGRFKDLYLSGGVYLGGTGAANKLDDVETGNWTPVINGGGGNPSSPVYGEQLGTYTKVGNTVTVNCVVKINSLSSNGSGGVEIGGLPFSGKTQTSIYQPAAINIEGINTALTSDSIIGLIPSSSSTFYIYRNNAGTGGMAQITWGTYWIAGSRLRFNMTYFTN